MKKLINKTIVLLQQFIFFMSKFTYNIKALADSDTLNLTINGEIGGENEFYAFNTAEEFSDKIKYFKNGQTKCHLYINSPGGSCFDANEIVNIIKREFKSFTATGGALVASAASYIAISADKFTLPKNGVVLIHKPSMLLEGNNDLINSELKLLDVLTEDYFNVYNAKASDKNKFKKSWDSGRDIWMSATEAKDLGFCDEIINENAKFTALISAEIPDDIKNKYNISNNINMNKLSLIAAKLNLPGVTAESSDEAVLLAIEAKFKELNENLVANEKKEKERQVALIKSMIDGAIKANKINATQREIFEKIGNDSGVDALQRLFDAMQVTGSLVSKTVPQSGGDEIKNFKDLMANGIDIDTYRAENPENYAKMFKAEFGREPKI